MEKLDKTKPKNIVDEEYVPKSLKKHKVRKQSKPKNYRSEFEQLIKTCMVTYNYQDESKDKSEKATKIMALSKILEAMATSERAFIDTVLKPLIDQFMEMIEVNIFRPLPAFKVTDLEEMDENADQNDKDKAWSTLIYVYEIFIHIIKHPAVSENVLKQFLTESYVQNLLDLFESGNKEERDYLKQAVHKLYAKVVRRRKMFRKMFNNHFLSIVYERPDVIGASEILDIYSSIISGFAVPLRPEHHDFFKTFLTPLLKVQNFNCFYVELIRCLMIFLTKDTALTKHLIMNLLEFWPYGNTTKEIGFIAPMHETIDFISDLDEFESYKVPLFKRISSCLNSDHVQIIDRAMTFFEKDNFLNIIKTNSDTIYPIIVPVVERQLKDHWHKQIKTNFRDLQTILKELDGLAYTDACTEIKTQIESKLSKRLKLDTRWMLLEAKLKEVEPDYTPPSLPFKSDALVSDYNKLYSGTNSPE